MLCFLVLGLVSRLCARSKGGPGEFKKAVATAGDANESIVRKIHLAGRILEITKTTVKPQAAPPQDRVCKFLWQCPKLFVKGSMNVYWSEGSGYEQEKLLTGKSLSVETSALSHLQIRIDWPQRLQMQEAAAKIGSADPLSCCAAADGAFAANPAGRGPGGRELWRPQPPGIPSILICRCDRALVVHSA